MKWSFTFWNDLISQDGKLKIDDRRHTFSFSCLGKNWQKFQKSSFSWLRKRYHKKINDCYSWSGYSLLNNSFLGNTASEGDFLRNRSRNFLRFIEAVPIHASVRIYLHPKLLSTISIQVFIMFLFSKGFL